MASFPSIILYDGNFVGRELKLNDATPNLSALHFNDTTNSVKVLHGTWTLYHASDYKGQHITLNEGEYDEKYIRDNIGINVISSARPASIILYDGNFAGRELILYNDSANLSVLGFNDKTNSVKVLHGTWTLYHAGNYEQFSITLDEGNYDEKYIAANIGVNSISSVKLISKTPSIILFDGPDDFAGRQHKLTENVADLRVVGFNDRANSIRVLSGVWSLYHASDYKGWYITLGVGDYDEAYIREKIGINVISSAQQASIILYDAPGFKGKEIKLTEDTPTFSDLGFNNRTTSIKVVNGTWILYQDADFKGWYIRLSEGDYDSAYIQEKIGNDTISSAKILN